MSSERVPSGSQALLDRDQELAEIDTLIDAAATEQGAFVVLEGRSGMGKSALLAEVRKRAAASGFTTCSALGSELEGEFAFGVIRQLFEPAIGALNKGERARVFEGAAALAEPVLGIGGEPMARDQFAALHGLYWLAANLSARTPVLLAVDDSHWADVASLRWLAYLLNRLEGLPIMAAVAARPVRSGPQGAVLAAILAHPAVRILPLRPLGEGSVAALVRITLDAEPHPVFTAACLQATAGNPLGVSELLRELRADGVAPSRAAAGGLDLRPPEAINRRVLRDLSRLGNEAGRLARALAVMGDGTRLPLVARLADLEVDRAAEVTDDLQSADLLTPERPPRFAHPLLRAAVYDHLPAGARQKLHRRAGQILGSEGAEPEAVAAHLLRCEADRSGETIECLRAAAPRALRRGVPRAAVLYLRRALAEEADAATRTRVLVELGRAELAAGDAIAVSHLKEALAGSAEPRTRAAILADLSLAVVVQGDEWSARDLLQAALAELRSSDTDASARLECIAIGMASFDPRFALSVDSYLPRLQQLARGGTRHAELARAMVAVLVAWRGGSREEAVSWIGEGFDWSRLFGGGRSHLFGVTWSTLALLSIDEPAKAVGWCETVMREGTAEGHPTVATAMVWRARAELQMGRLAEAEADARAAFESSQQHFPLWVPVIAAYLAEVLFERGQQHAAFELIESVTVSPGLVGGLTEPTLLQVRGRLRCARGWQKRGIDDFRAAGRICETLVLRNPIFHIWRASLATALAQDCIEEAQQVAEEYLANARRSGIPRAIGVALGTQAAVCHTGEAIDLLRAAIAALETSSAPLDLACALADLGSALRRQGHRVEAREPLREALEIAARCGAVPLMERVRAEALAAGARPRSPRLRGVDALTPSELRVARLAAEGRSNREIAQALFISTKTVADHLGNCYSKLDIRSREHLNAALGLRTGVIAAP